jgi:hypothetical protein
VAVVVSFDAQSCSTLPSLRSIYFASRGCNFLSGLDHSIIPVDLRIFCRPGDVDLLGAVMAHEAVLDSLAAFIDFVPEYRTKDPLAEVTVSLRSDSRSNTLFEQH